MTAANPQNPQAEGVSRLHSVLLALLLPLYFALFLFVPAGSWTWEQGWLFVVVFLAAMSFIVLYLSRVNPEVVVARSRPHQGTKPWDKILLSFYLPAVSVIAPVAALDAARYHWLPLPWWVCGGGYVVFLAGMAVTAWAEAANRFFEVTVRIQTDRGQVVIDSGPYAVVRHPGYVGGLLVAPGIALSLGSLWALIPALLSCLLLILRTRWEDQTLQAELAGYKEYTRRVRYRLVPWVW